MTTERERIADLARQHSWDNDARELGYTDLETPDTLADALASVDDSTLDALTEALRVERRRRRSRRTTT